ncbi:hypothetical protein ACFZB9_19435 [Kitasatospora sp. NPDC008050]|uniref:hypothetical protein n=1 Tax=Kitasatospora sp. NPDC008050 TaxID=3364021 RepID=UPI0036E0A03B
MSVSVKHIAAVLCVGVALGLSVFVTPSRLTSTRTYGVLCAFGRGMVGGVPYLHAMVRHPYEYWTAHFSHHHRTYRYSEILLLDELLRQTAQTGSVQLLGDPHWLAGAVQRLAPLDLRRPRAVRAAVQQVLAAPAAG